MLQEGLATANPRQWGHIGGGRGKDNGLAGGLWEGVLATEHTESTEWGLASPLAGDQWEGSGGAKVYLDTWSAARVTYQWKSKIS